VLYNRLVSQILDSVQPYLLNFDDTFVTDSVKCTEWSAKLSSTSSICCGIVAQQVIQPSCTTSHMSRCCGFVVGFQFYVDYMWTFIADLLSHLLYGMLYNKSTTSCSIIIIIIITYNYY